MNNRKGYNRLGRKPSHRNALHRNMVTSLFKYGRIKTTKAKAKEIRKTAEKMVTRAKVDSVHNRRIIAKDIRDKAVIGKLFTIISPNFSSRNGGYTRILKLGYRNNDAAEMVFLELLETEEEKKKKKADKADKKAKKEEKQSEAAAAEPETADEPEPAAESADEAEPEKTDKE